MKNQFEYQIGLDQICNINNNTNNIDPKILTCSVCFCINIDVKECKNKKCSKLFCGKCFDALANNKSKQKLCPYCRTKFDYYIADESLTNTINVPSMSEEIAIKNNRVYILFESAGKKYKIFNRKQLKNVYSLSLDNL